jgi:hypothetical protein
MESIFLSLLAVYIIVLCILLIFVNLTIQGNFVKVLFWPISGLIYFIAFLFGFFVYSIRGIYRGIIVCIEEFKELFTDMWYAGEEDD